MISGLLGKKIGMTQIFDRDGSVVPVTAVEVGPCYVLGLIDSPKKKLQIGFETVKESRVKKPRAGLFKKVNVKPLRIIKEFISSDNSAYQLGQEIKADFFQAGDFVDVSGISIGKGFQGGMKRWHWSGGPGSHGSMHHRRIGSVSASSDPSRVFVGHHMPGHMGHQRVTIQSLRIMQVDVENNIVLINGAVPGAANGYLEIRKSRKKAFRSLDEQKVVHEAKKNPMKAAKAKATGKGGK